ncbi:hypothetical protein M378DRAFT_550290 [Amanita muscaria Koide BX008]|uniref:Cytochrome P450 n=1 Tax=Amanita muscaria (strain Koide BX008) TaxID=946122 RepID=A0A0C2S003_AMAMK|nr:hypothetical protein M378DRAFT_550290 [Amanita muscaria Koide BX008]
MTEMGEYLVPFLLALAAVVSYRFLRAKQTAQTAPYPPGPLPKPIIGNALDIPLKKTWMKYIEWSKQLNNNIIHLTAMNTHIVVLNSLDDIVELMERKSANYSSRPSLTLFKLV